MVCIDEIDAGASQAQAELLFLLGLIELVKSVDPRANRVRASGTLGFTDIYRSPAFGADHFIRLSNPSVRLMEDIAALRVLAFELVGYAVETANLCHGTSPVVRDGRTSAN
jgi:hypothetical protein